MKTQGENEVPLSTVKHALKNPQMAELKIKKAIAALPEEERDNAGGMRVSLDKDREGGGAYFCVDKDYLAQLVLDGVVETHGKDAGKNVGDLIAEAGLASKYPQGRG
jgi:hypothetical protein